MGEWSLLSMHGINSGAAPAFFSKQRDPDAILTEKYPLVIGTVTGNLGAGQQQSQDMQVRQGTGQFVFALNLYVQPVYSLSL